MYNDFEVDGCGGCDSQQHLLDHLAELDGHGNDQRGRNDLRGRAGIRCHCDVLRHRRRHFGEYHWDDQLQRHGDNHAERLRRGRGNRHDVVTASVGTISNTTTVTVSSTAPASSVATLTVTSSVSNVPSDGSAAAVITVLAKDVNNNAVSGAPVTISASAGTLTGATTSTGANGTVTANLSAAGVAAGTTITITATSGTVTGKGSVSVVATQQTILLLTSSPQLPSANTAPVTITAIVQGASNQLVPGVQVTFQASSGAIAATQTTAGKAANVVAGTTDANGTAQATLTTPGNYVNRAITVTATAGSSSNTIQVQVVGTQLNVSGPNNLVVGASGTYSVSLLDSGGNAISGQTVALASALGNTVTAGTAPSPVTNSTGTAAFSMMATNSGSDTLTATWQTQSSTQAVAISSQSFSFTKPTAAQVVDIGTAQPVVISWSQTGTPQSGTVQFTTSRGTLSNSQPVPVSSGALTTPVTISSTTAGNAIIAATAFNASNQVVATAQISIQFVATNPTAVSVQASPSTVPIQGQSVVTATVTDPIGNPVDNVKVDFNLVDTTNGQLSAAYAYTNFNGLATVTYSASTSASAPNGVVVTASVDGSNPLISNAVDLTVGGQTVFLSLGTGNTITALSSTQYEMPYSVQAVDSAGNGVSGVTVVFKIEATGYYTGNLGWSGTEWVTPDATAVPVAIQSPLCAPTIVQEYNGVIDPNPTPTGVTAVNTDIPGSVASTDVNGGTTGTGGSAPVNLIYPKDHALWVQVVLTATATVSGTQSATSSTFILPGLASDYTTQTVSPPGQKSPYGTTGACW